MEKEKFLNEYLEWSIKNKQDIQDTFNRTKEKAYKISLYILSSIGVAIGFLFSYKDYRFIILLYIFLSILILTYLFKTALSSQVLPNIFPILNNDIINSFNRDISQNNKEDISKNSIMHFKIIEIKKANEDYDKINEINKNISISVNRTTNFCFLAFIFCFVLIMFYCF